MTGIQNFLNGPPAQALGWALLHFFWQGSAIAGVLGLVRSVFPAWPARSHYAAACLALLAMLAAPVITFAVYYPAGQTIPAGAAEPAGPGGPAGSSLTGGQAWPEPDAVPGRTSFLPPLLGRVTPWLTPGWLLGVLLLSVRLLGNWLYFRRLQSFGVRPLPDPWPGRVAVLCRKAGLTRPVRLLESALARVPSVSGWLKPVILIPASAVLGMEPRQLEAIIAHELAHLRRCDYLVNLMQTAVEILLFYHPAVWWVSRRIRIERENCCDDLAVELCGDGLLYARALAGLEGLRSSPARLALAAGGGSLLVRIRRIAGLASPSPARRSYPWLALLLLGTVLSCGGAAAWWLHPPAKAAAASPAAVEPARQPGFVASLAALGYKNLTAEDLITLKDHDVTPAYIQSWQGQGYRQLTIPRLIRLRDHEVPPGLAAACRKAGLDGLTAEDFIRLHDHGIDGDFVRRAADRGGNPLSVIGLIRLKNVETGD